MTKLLEYYDEMQKRTLVGCAFVWFIMTTISVYFLEEIITGIIAWSGTITAVDLSSLLDPNFLKFIIYVADFLLPASLAWTLYGKWLDYVDKTGWKRRFPQYDISGEWEDWTTYTNMIESTGWVGTDKIADNLKEKSWTDGDNPSVPSSVIIFQTCHIIRIEVSHGGGFTWRSLAAAWEDNILKILYEVDYNDVLRNKGYPQQRFGFERMSIDRSGLTPKQKPQKMTGQFWHCIANDDKPVLMGDVTYKRI